MFLELTQGPESHSELLDPLLRVRTERVWGGRTVKPCWGRTVIKSERLYRAGWSVTVSKLVYPYDQGKHSSLVTCTNLLKAELNSSYILPYHALENVRTVLGALGHLVVNGGLHLPLQVPPQQIGRIHLEQLLIIPTVP